MSERPLDINLTQGTETRVTGPTEAEKKAFRHKIAHVLDRSLTVDRMEVHLPPELEGFWCSRDSVAIASAEMRGYAIDKTHGKLNKLNDTADDTAVVGDVIFMTRPKWMGEIEREQIAKRYHDTHIRDKRKMKEEQEFLAQNELPVAVDKSIAVDATGPQIEEVLSSKR